MDKIKVGIFIDAFFPMMDGVINVVDNLAKILKDKLDITIFTIKPRGKVDTIEHPYKVVRCKSMALPGLDYDMPLPSFDRKFKKTLKDSTLDLVYCHSPVYMASQAIKYAKKHNVPVLAHLHSQFKQDIYRAVRLKGLTNIILKVFLKNFNKADKAIAVNEFTKELFENEYHLKTPITVVYNATDMLPLENQSKAIDFVNEKYKFGADEKILLFVGRINKLKNIDLILDSASVLTKSFNNFKLLLVGSGGDEDYFKKKTSDLKLEDKVIFAGKVTDRDELRAIYLRADLFLFPSRYDTDGLVKLEAASQGTPTVFIENTGAVSSIKDNITGFVAKDDKFSFAKKIEEALTDKELYNYVCQNVKNKLYRTWQDSAQEIYEIILKMVKENRADKEAKHKKS